MEPLFPRETPKSNTEGVTLYNGTENHDEHLQNGDEPYEDDYSTGSLLSDEEDSDGGVDISLTNGNLTKSYNRQKSLQSALQNSTAIPSSNTQKPTANTQARIDDQISSLAKHASKIRIDDLPAQKSGKDKSERATSEQVLDPRTRMILLQLLNRGKLSEVNGCLSTGKEANVYHALSGSDPPDVYAIKIFKTSILVFKDRARYVEGEHRFKNGFNKSSNRAMVKVWAEKEFRNLKRIHSAGIPCPEPVILKSHVLIMTFLGSKKGWPAPRLRDADIADEKRWTDLYVSAAGIMRRMFQVCRIVHADLSEYNMLYHQEKLFIIDVSQSVEHDHPKSLEFLRTDIKNVNDFFRRKSVDVLSDQKLYVFITQASGGAEFLAMTEVVHSLMANRRQDEVDGTDDEAVFRQQYIPQTLEQVYDIERDAALVHKAGDGGLVYQDLLASHNQAKDPHKDQNTLDSTSDDSEASDTSESNSNDESKFEKGQPRGKRFEDKDSKREHKKKIKEEKREKRKTKMPKHIKKRLVNQTASKKKH